MVTLLLFFFLLIVNITRIYIKFNCALNSSIFFFVTKKLSEKKIWKKNWRKKSEKSKILIFRKSRFSIFGIFKIFIFISKFLIFLKFQNFQNEKSPRLKNIFRSDFFYSRDIHLYYPKNAFRYNSWTGASIWAIRDNHRYTPNQLKSRFSSNNTWKPGF